MPDIYTLSLLAAADGAETPGLLNQMMPFALLGVMFLVFYLFVIRPQKKRDKEQAQMRNNLSIGDEIVTIGGVIGRVVSIKDDTITIVTSSDGTKIMFHKTAVQSKTAAGASDSQKVSQSAQNAAKNIEGDEGKKKYKFKK